MLDGRGARDAAEARVLSPAGLRLRPLSAGGENESLPPSQPFRVVTRFARRLKIRINISDLAGVAAPIERTEDLARSNRSTLE